MTPDKRDVLYGARGLMVIKDLESPGPAARLWDRAANRTD
jgi:hypothetical protein